jgi:hypothetical protein
LHPVKKLLLATSSSRTILSTPKRPPSASFHSSQREHVQISFLTKGTWLDSVPHKGNMDKSHTLQREHVQIVRKFVRASPLASRFRRDSPPSSRLAGKPSKSPSCIASRFKSPGYVPSGFKSPSYVPSRSLGTAKVPDPWHCRTSHFPQRDKSPPPLAQGRSSRQPCRMSPRTDGKSRQLKADTGGATAAQIWAPPLAGPTHSPSSTSWAMQYIIRAKQKLPYGIFNAAKRQEPSTDFLNRN